MKTFLYFVSIAGILLFASFAPPGKQRKIKLLPENHAGLIEWVKTIPYQAIKDSSGAIVKGALNYPVSKIASWTTYGQYGDKIEADQYDSQGNIHKTTYQYYPNGDIKEIIKDSSVLTGQRLIKHIRGIETCDRNIYAYTYSYKRFDTKYMYRYDASGNLLYFSQRDYDSGSTTPYSSSLTTFFYNSQGNLLDKYTYGSDTVHPNTSTLYRYDEMGHLTEEDKAMRTNAPGYFEDMAPTGKTIFTGMHTGRYLLRQIISSTPASHKMKKQPTTIRGIPWKTQKRIIYLTEVTML